MGSGEGPSSEVLVPGDDVVLHRHRQHVEISISIEITREEAPDIVDGRGYDLLGAEHRALRAAQAAESDGEAQQADGPLKSRGSELRHCWNPPWALGQPSRVKRGMSGAET